MTGSSAASWPPRLWPVRRWTFIAQRKQPSRQVGPFRGGVALACGRIGAARASSLEIVAISVSTARAAPRGLVMRGRRGLASFVIRPPRAAAERNLDLLRRCQLTLGCLVEAGGRRYRHHEWTEDHVELLDFADGDDAEYYPGQQCADHERQQRDGQVRDSPASLVFQRPWITGYATPRGCNVVRGVPKKTREAPGQRRVATECLKVRPSQVVQSSAGLIE